MTTTLRQGAMRSAFSLAISIAAAAAACLPQPASGQMPKGEAVRDRLWLFSCATNSDFVHIGRRSVVSPAEGAYYLGVPNIVMVQSNEKEARYGRLESPFEQYTVALRPLKSVVWSVVGSGGFRKAEETAEVLAMAKRVPNFRGVMLDDFLTDNKTPAPGNDRRRDESQMWGDGTIFLLFDWTPCALRSDRIPRAAVCRIGLERSGGLHRGAPSKR